MLRAVRYTPRTANTATNQHFWSIGILLIIVPKANVTFPNWLHKLLCSITRIREKIVPQPVTQDPSLQARTERCSCISWMTIHQLQGSCLAAWGLPPGIVRCLPGVDPVKPLPYFKRGETTSLTSTINKSINVYDESSQSVLEITNRHCMLLPYCRNSVSRTFGRRWQSLSSETPLTAVMQWQS